MKLQFFVIVFLLMFALYTTSEISLLKKDLRAEKDKRLALENLIKKTQNEYKITQMARKELKKNETLNNTKKEKIIKKINLQSDTLAQEKINAYLQRVYNDL